MIERGHMSFNVTLTIVMLTAGLFGFATWRARQPVDPLKVRLFKINYHVVQIFCIVALMYLIVHLMAFFGVQPSQQAGRPF